MNKEDLDWDALASIKNKYNMVKYKYVYPVINKYTSNIFNKIMKLTWYFTELKKRDKKTIRVVGKLDAASSKI